MKRSYPAATIGLLFAAFSIAIPALLWAGPATAQNPAPVRLRAVIDSFADQTLTVTTRDGKKLTLTLTDRTKIASVSKAAITDIKPGTYIGTAATAPAAAGQGQNGQSQNDQGQSSQPLRALEVHIFPESMRGTGEGHRPWDSGDGSSSDGSGKAASNSMTNGTVGQIAGDVVANGGRHITVTYHGGEQQVEIPADTPIVAIGRGDRSLLQPGAHLIAFASKYSDGSLLADHLLIGKDGLTPPM